VVRLSSGPSILKTVAGLPGNRGGIYGGQSRSGKMFFPSHCIIPPLVQGHEVAVGSSTDGLIRESAKKQCSFGNRAALSRNTFERSSPFSGYIETNIDSLFSRSFLHGSGNKFTNLWCDETVLLFYNKKQRNSWYNLHFKFLVLNFTQIHHEIANMNKKFTAFHSIHFF
jgi:hypothetical protein